MGYFLLVASLHLCAFQKPAIDTGAINHWPSLAITPAISPRGNYMAYNISSATASSPRLVLRATRRIWEKELTGAAHCYFYGDETHAVLPKADSLLFMELGADSGWAIRVKSFQFPSAGECRWLAYQQQPDGRLILVDLRSGTSSELGPATQYVFDPYGRALVIKDTFGISCIDLVTGMQKRVYRMQRGEALQELRWDEEGRQFVFLTHGVTTRVWYYKRGDPSARVKAEGADLDGPVQFSHNGKWLFFTRARSSATPLTRPTRATTAAITWSWRDTELRQDAPTTQVSCWAVVAADDTVSRQTDFKSRRLLTPPSLITGNWALVGDSAGCWLVSLVDGAQRRIGKAGEYPQDFVFSPGGKWFVFYDPVKAQYISCDPGTGALHNLTAHLPRSISSEFPRGVDAQAVAEPAGWLQGDRAVLIYDNYDLWAIDPAGVRQPLNLTLGYGFRHHIKLRLVESEGNFSYGDTLLLTGFNTTNKYNGFFRLVPAPKPRLDSLYMGPYTFYRVESQKPHRYSFDDGMKPLKAAETNCWLVKRESECEAPNYFLTTDFRQFEPMTMLAPQKDYCWLTAELINYPLPDGETAQGVLYKPEDFDPGKKYPVLFNIYEQYSHRLYEFPRPALCHDNINIPWFVSRGYLVFTPDIYYRPANSSNRTIGDWASRSVVAAVRRLKQMPFVDARRLGIQGHSLGAEETIDILTRTGEFSAAAEMAGATDAISTYLTLLPSGGYPAETRESQYIWEHGQGRMGATPWQRPELYRKESAVLHADRIVTPLLIIHNPQDAAVQYRQGIELFMALRRLKKQVWMLQYPEENHIIFQTEAALDYTLKLNEFFGHFLKDQPCHAWMLPRN